MSIETVALTMFAAGFCAGVLVMAIVVGRRVKDLNDRIDRELFRHNDTTDSNKPY